MSTLVWEGLSCEFGGIKALREVSGQVAADEFVAVAGHNAAGKTTLLNALSGAIRPTTGRVTLHGKDIGTASIASRAASGLVRSFEDGGVCDSMPAIDNVVLGLRSGSLSSRRARARHWLLTIGLADVTLLGANLSIGQRRRMQLAQILARIDERNGNQCVVLLDEPFRGLDAEGTQDIVRLFVEHLKGRVPVLMVEHDGLLVTQLASRTIYLENGAVSSKSVADRPDSRPRTDTRGRPGSPMLVLRDVRAGYGSLDVLHGASLSIAGDEIVLLQGNNGAGKSTLIRTVVGLLRPKAGRVEILGREVAGSIGCSSLGVGYAPQGGRLIAGLTVQEHLHMARLVALRADRQPHLGPLFLKAFPEVADILGRQVGALSSGQRSLVSFATAMELEPRLLVADEPAAGMAPGLAGRLWEFLQVIWRSPERAALVVEHRANMTGFTRQERVVHGVIEGQRPCKA